MVAMPAAQQTSRPAPHVLEAVLERISDRLQRENPVALALPVLESLEGPLERDFEALWSALARAAAAERERLLGATP